MPLFINAVAYGAGIVPQQRSGLYMNVFDSGFHLYCGGLELFGTLQSILGSVVI